MLLAGPAASASGAASVRLVHAVPGAGTAQLHAGTGETLPPVGAATGFGEVGGYARVPAGAVTFELRGSGGRPLATTKEQLAPRAHYTLVAIGAGGGKLELLRDGRARPGESRLRVVHAAPELGDVEVRLGDARFGTLGFQDVAGYTAVDPGAYAIRVTRPGGGSTLAARGGVPLTAGTSSTAFVVGSAGEPLGVVVASDRAAAPRGAPKTGLGGLSDDDSPLLLALLAGLLAAAAGAGGYLVLTGRSRGRES
jgi:Domain of unknown function (DUF4397)